MPAVPLDQFEVFNEVVRRGRRSLLRELFAYFVGVFGLLMWFLAANRPVPVVVWGNDAQTENRLVFAGDAQVREIDAKRFFHKMLQQLHGWNSANVIEELSAARMLMTAEWRAHFEGEVNQQVDVPPEISNTGKATLLSTYINARVRNDVDLDWEKIKCKPALQGLWHCKASISIEPQPLLGAPIDSDRVRKRYTVKASFQEVPISTKTVDGLLVRFWDAREVDS